MDIKKIFLLIVASLLIGTALLYISFKDRNEVKLNVVELNDIAETLVEQWEELEQIELPGLSYGLAYVVLDHNNQFLRSTRTGLNTTLNSAISNRDTIVDLGTGQAILGKLIIYNDTHDTLQDYKNGLLFLSIVIMVSVALCCLIYPLIINRAIILPFKKLQGFAKEVAKGNLDLPLEMDKGNLFGAFTESFDLMREELNRARENERKANQSKKELVASLSHDINTPVASIKAVSEIMFLKSKNDNEKNQLQIINAKADQISGLITNIFNATLEELQELRVQTTEQSSNILVELIRNADYNSKVTLSLTEECLILVDSTRLSQVIDNVISNSYKYAGTSIHVSSHINNAYLEVIFKDFGLGISEDERPLIFNKYYRANNAMDKSGTGLGLYISKFLMNKMSGDIDCKNTSDGFIMVLKLRII